MTSTESLQPNSTPGIEGSFDAPPVVVKQNRKTLAFICVAIIGMGVLLAVTPTRDPTQGKAVWHLVLLGLIGVGALLSALQAMSPATLTLDPSGLVKRTIFRTTHYQWNDFSGFLWYTTRGGRTVVGEPSDSLRARLGWRGAFAGRVTLGGNWELAAPKVVDLLNAARERWKTPA